MYLKRAWRDFIISGLRARETDFEKFILRTKLKFLNIAFLYGILFSFFVIGLQVAQAQWDALPYLALFPAVFLASILILRRTRNVATGNAIFLSAYIAAVMYGLGIGGYASMSLLLIFSFPVITFYLSGKKSGVLWIGALLFLLGSMVAMAGLDIIVLRVSLRLMMIGLINLCVVSAFTYLLGVRHRRIEELMRRQIYNDSLTGLPNRKRLLADLDEAKSPVLFLVNVDDFKEINDIFGYRIGDSVLVFLAKVLRHILPDYVSGIYKLAGDEFALLVDARDRKISRIMLVNVAMMITDYLRREKYGYAKYEIILRVSIGIALAEEVGSGNLFSCADMALKTAKSLRKPYMFFREATDTRSVYQENLKLLNVLADAIEADRIFPYYMPIVYNSTGEVRKYECLVRIVDRDGKILYPKDVIPIAKKSRLYQKLTRVMIRKAFDTFRNSDTEFSINISVEDFMDPYTLQYIKIALSETPAVKGRVSFEILESESVDNFQEFSNFILEMKELGCKISIDDFGAGYSNFEYLVNLNPDYLKIDGALIRKVHSDEKSRLLVENIVGITKKMGIETIAEYVHTGEIYLVVKDLGIDYSQGYFLGEPKPAILDGRQIEILYQSIAAGVGM
jgi:diguanylate cyclase (GGDEF)-like protein